MREESRKVLEARWIVLASSDSDLKMRQPDGIVQVRRGVGLGCRPRHRAWTRSVLEKCVCVSLHVLHNEQVCDRPSSRLASCYPSCS